MLFRKRRSYSCSTVNSARFGIYADGGRRHRYRRTDFDTPRPCGRGREEKIVHRRARQRCTRRRVYAHKLASCFPSVAVNRRCIIAARRDATRFPLERTVHSKTQYAFLPSLYKAASVRFVPGSVSIHSACVVPVARHEYRFTCRLRRPEPLSPPFTRATRPAVDSRGAHAVQCV